MSLLPWIALAVAVDSNGKAAKALKTAGRPTNFVIVRPVHQVTVSLAEDSASVWQKLCAGTKCVLDKKPYGEYGLRTSDVIGMEQFEDDDKTPFVRLAISEDAGIRDEEDRHMIGLFIPGTLEEVAAVINAANVE
jgi:hypothetical protein